MRSTKTQNVIEYMSQELLNDRQRQRYDLLAETGVEKMQLEFILMESSGGKCPGCREEWPKVEVKNQYADFFYFYPECHCWDKCGRCGTSLYAVTLPNTKVHHYRCPSCYYTWPEVVPEEEDKAKGWRV
jgi:uncharacterized Zn ribbon protein